MADKKGRNLPAKKYTHSNPTELRLSFELTGPGTKFIDIAKALSEFNRKFVSQQAYFYVNKIECYNNSNAHVDVHTIPDTWVTKNAYRRGRAMYEANRALLDPPATGGITTKYEDFKVFMTYRHAALAASNPSLTPSVYEIDASDVTVGTGEWTYTQLVSSDDNQDTINVADGFYLHMIGDHTPSSIPGQWESVGLIKSYGDSRTAVDATSPNNSLVDITDPLLNLHDNSSEEQINALATLAKTENDEPPYSVVNYLGEGNASMSHQARLVTTSETGRVTSAPGFCAPFGLICIDPDTSVGSSDRFRIVLTLAPGPYHGVYAERV